MSFLVLQDGTAFEGESFGAWPKDREQQTQAGEVVFNTSMSGYQEMITDLSYSGQILVLTHPQIGGSGWHDEENEADKILLKGLVVRELSQGEGSDHRDRSIEEFCNLHKIWGLKGIDTRSLTRHIRDHGTIPGVFAHTFEQGMEFWQKYGENSSTVVENRSHWVYKATVQESYEIPGSGPYVAVIDCGTKRNILRKLQQKGLRIRVFPAWSSAEEILATSPKGILLSNGPGDPSELPEIIETVRTLLPKLPMMGIGLGHQFLALAAGGKTYKLPFGHRGNHPVQDVRTGKTTMTAQNHGYVVDADSLEGKGFQVLLRNLNDRTVEGMEHDEYPIFSVQYYPEGAPGPEENMVLFERFFAAIGA